MFEIINGVLPQLQCKKCGFPDCDAYAKALDVGKTDLNRCSPGGDATIKALAKILQKDPKPIAKEVASHDLDAKVVIQEADCIGCTLCLNSCPVDAIVGAKHQIHSILSEYCTACGLCIPTCPVDCIQSVKGNSSLTAQNTTLLQRNATNSDQKAIVSKDRYKTHKTRLESVIHQPPSNDPFVLEDELKPSAKDSESSIKTKEINAAIVEARRRVESTKKSAGLHHVAGK